MSSTRPKNALFEAIAVMGKAFASPRRLELIDLLAQGPRSVDELARVSGQSTANASQHLQALRLWLALRDASASRLAEVERAARDHVGEEVERITPEELRARLASEDVVLIDVRPTEEYAAGHIESAVSIPMEELDERLKELPKDREIVAYCRGPFCAFAHDAVRRLNSSGREARRLEQGWPEWRLAHAGSQST